MVLAQLPNGRLQVGFTEEAMQTKNQIEMVAQLAVMVETADVQELLKQFNHLDVIGPIFDPTAYMSVLKTKGGHERLTVAFLKFRQELDAIIAGDVR